MVLEAAGFDIVFVETVGVGQSETTVAGMVDTFLLLMLARTGDSLQGIKKGVLELADVIAINKADGDRAIEAEGAARELSAALHLVAGSSHGWDPPVLTCSALEERGLDDVWRHSQPTASTSSTPGRSTSTGAARRSTGCGRRSTTGCSPGSAADRRCTSGSPTLEEAVRNGETTAPRRPRAPRPRAATNRRRYDGA